jgi:hypothetical protein
MYFNNEKIGQGIDATRTFLLGNLELFLKIKEEVMK